MHPVHDMAPLEDNMDLTLRSSVNLSPTPEGSYDTITLDSPVHTQGTHGGENISEGQSGSTSLSPEKERNHVENTDKERMVLRSTIPTLQPLALPQKLRGEGVQESNSIIEEGDNESGYYSAQEHLGTNTQADDIINDEKINTRLTGQDQILWT